VAAAYEIGKFAVASTKAAAVFQQNNTLLTTQAGVAQSRISKLGDAFLTLAPKLGQTATALSQGFYHIASAGVPAAQQIATLKAAAMGAAVGNANLEDTTNALVGALRSGVGGITSAKNAMATLMAIVGAGNMRLQDLNAAMGTGILGTAKTFGVSMQSVGAALAYFTDTGMQAAPAATRLAMAIPLLGAPTKQATKILGALGLASKDIAVRQDAVRTALQKAGVSYSQLASDMRRPDGLVVALQDLKTHMTAAGVSAETQAAVISRAFGGGHMGKAIMMAYENLPKIAQKFTQINASVSSFGKHWVETTQTAIFQSKSLHGAMSSISIAIGEAILPAVQKLLSAIVPVVSRLAEWTTKHKTLAAVILGSMFVFSLLLAALSALGLAIMAFPALAALGPFAGIVLGLAAVTGGAKLAADQVQKLADKYHLNLGGRIKDLQQLRDLQKTEPALAAALARQPGYASQLRQMPPGPKIDRHAQSMWDNLSGYLSTLWNRIVAYAEMVWTNFKSWLTTVWGDILNDATVAWNNFTSFLGGIWADVKNGVIDAWNNVINWFRGLPGRILAALVDAGNWLLEVGSDIIHGLWEGIKDGWNAVVGFFSRLGSTIAGWFVSAATWLLGEGRAVITGLWNGITAVWATISGWFGGMGARVSGYFGGAVKWLLAEGQVVITGLWNGITAAWATVSGWFGGMGARVSGYFAGAVGWLATEGRTVITGLWSGMKAIWGQAETWFSRFKGMIVQFFGGAAHWLADIGGNILQGLWDGLKSKWHALESWLGGIATTIANTVKGPLGIKSPSKVFEEIGMNVILGLQGGVSSQLGALNNTLTQATAGLVRSATSGGNSAGRGVALAGGGGGGGTTIVFDMRGSQYIDDASIQRLTDKIGGALATKGLPMSGMQLRRG
jgi:TP901 family phage tail tape measure protein